MAKLETMMPSGFPGLPFRADVAVALLVVVLGSPLLYTINTLLVKWLRAVRARRIFESQGIKCLPRSSFLSGNMHEFSAFNAGARAQPMPEVSHDVARRLLPHIYAWSEAYGEHFVFWFGFQPRYVLKDPEQARELMSNKSGHFRVPQERPEFKDFLGNGLVFLNGEKWSQHRRILTPAFFLEKLKAMAPTMVDLTVSMIKNWESNVEQKEAIDVSEQFRNLTADIIAHTAFGSSFAEGKLVFELQQKQQEVLSKLLAVPYIPGARFLPTRHNRSFNRLKQRIHEVLGQIIQKRLELRDASQVDEYGNDLLGLMLAANKLEPVGNQKTYSMGMHELVDECKTFFFAGHGSTATLLTFTFLLLASRPEWQELLREEVLEVCGKKKPPTADSLNHLKLVGMVVNESLRLYPPAVNIGREAAKDVKLGDTLIPAGTVIMVPIIAWHHDERFWGSKAKEFHPERFEAGILKACETPGAYLPFSYGPRTCIGQAFTNIEAKMVLATLLQKYRFHLSPQYVHAPTILLHVSPQFGMPMIFEEIE